MPQRRQTTTPPSSRPRSRTALAAGLVATLAVTPGLIAAGSVLASASETAGAATTGEPLADNEKFGAYDASLLAEARARHEPYVTMMIAAEPGETEAVADRVDSLDGASVGYSEESVGYIRATVRTGHADAAIAEAAGLDSVHAIDLKEEFTVPDAVPASAAGDAATTSEAYPGPGADTPRVNPYMPVEDTGAAEFTEDHPRYDGRGITIGVIDTGVDIAHPALQETTTGERKITDWVTATDPIVDGDGTWRAMNTQVSGTSFQFNGRQYTAPAGDHLINVFRESVTSGGEMAGDVNRDGDTADSWALLYDAEAGTVRVDSDGDADFTNNDPMAPYAEGHDIGSFGTDDPSTAIAEAMPFVIEIREDVPMDPLGGDWVGQVRDFVNIGIVSDAHGTHVAGITAANGLFGGEMSGAAPGAKVVSSRACAFPSCSSVALTEGMIDLVANRGVDVVNMSIGGLPPLNDGQSARELLYNELIDTHGVQLFISAGNDGPGTNTVGAPSTADKVISVGAAISRETWAANYGSAVERRYAMLPFSSTGPRDDGGFKPTLVAPGSAVSSIPTWQPGSGLPEAGYDLPPGYGMFNGTSMSSPQAAGAAALLLSAAEQRGIDASPAALRSALTTTADAVRGVQAHEQGSGLFDTAGAWRQLTRGGTAAHGYTVSAPVDHVLAGELETPGSGPGIYDRESAPSVGSSERYEVTVTRTTGPSRPVGHSVELVNNDERTFRLTGSAAGGWLSLPLNEPVTVTVEAKPRSLGAHSAILALDDPRTTGLDHQVMAAVVVAEDLADPAFSRSYADAVQRNDSTSYYVRVPEGARTLEVAMGGLDPESQTRFIAINPYGVPAEDTASNLCYPHYNPDNTCRPDLRSYADPLPGVWEIEVEARRTSPQLDNPYTVTPTALGTTFEPETVTIDEAQTGTPVPVSWEVTNGYAPIENGQLASGELGSALSERLSIDDGGTSTRTVEVPEGVSEFSVTLGNAADPGADIDLYVYRGEGEDAELVGSSTTSTAEEAVTLAEPQGGTYTIEVDGYEVPSGSTEYDYRDVYLSPDLGSVAVEERAISLQPGESTEVGAQVTVAGTVPEGRELTGEVRLLNGAGTSTGSGGIVIEQVAP
ncbi:S8 family serine peptidase [Streptomyces sp. 6N223]|uniref:S8 family serine peptidase n=1 Tax=Streptomyces sp. 6N223 TaxID=3457412 RepID=UPI003FD2D882